MITDTTKNTSMRDRVELRLELDPADLAVIDGFVNATGGSRTDVVRQLIRDWSSKKIHEAIVICRVAGINPADPESSRWHA